MSVILLLVDVDKKTAGLMADKVDPNQMMPSVVFNLGLHCLLRMSVQIG